MYKIKLTVILTAYCIAFLSQSTNGQEDLYDLDHSKSFANFLYQTQQYDLAAREYERVLILSSNDKVPIELLKSYRLGNLETIGLTRIDDLYPDVADVPFDIFLERSRMQLNLNQLDKLQDELTIIKCLTDDDRVLISNIIGVYQFSKTKTETSIKNDTNKAPLYSYAEFSIIDNTLQNYYSERWKKPWLAGTLSAILPGAGRLYAGDWKNAIVSLVFVGLNGYQSYRGFKRTGISSPSGWIFGAIGFGFYVGNIYGSAWTAKRKNEQKREYYQGLIDPYYFSN